MFKKIFFYILLMIFFISNQIFGAETSPDFCDAFPEAQATGILPIATAAENPLDIDKSEKDHANPEYAKTCTDTECAEPEITIDSILQKISSISEQPGGQNELIKLLNLLYLKKELLNIFIIEKANFTAEETIVSEILDKISQLESSLSYESLHILEEVEELLEKNNSDLRFSSIAMFFDFKNKIFAKIPVITSNFSQLLGLIKNHRESYPEDQLCGLPPLLKEKFQNEGEPFLSDGKHVSKFFKFFLNFPIGQLHNEASIRYQEDRRRGISISLIIKLVESIQQNVTETKKLFDCQTDIANLHSRSEDEDPEIRMQKLRSLFGDVELFENTYNTVYQFIHQSIKNKNVIISDGPDQGKPIPRALFIKNMEDLTAIVNDLDIMIKHMSHASAYMGKPGAIQAKLTSILQNLCDFINSTPRVKMLFNGYLLKFSNEIPTRKGDATTTIPNKRLIPYFLFLKQKYQAEIKLLQKQEKPKEEPKKKTKTKKHSRKQQCCAEPKRIKELKDENIVPQLDEKEASTIQSKSIAPKYEEPKPKAELLPKPIAENPSLQESKDPIDSKVEVMTAAASPSGNIRSVAAKIETALYGEEQTIKETDSYKIIVKSSGPLPSQGYTLVLYKDKMQPQKINPKDYKYLYPRKSDNFHMIPKALDISQSIRVDLGSEEESRFNSSVRPEQQIHLRPRMFALCVKAVMLSKYAFKSLERRSEPEVIELLSKRSCPGFYKGMFTYLFDEKKSDKFEGICFHRCFHEFPMELPF